MTDKPKSLGRRPPEERARIVQEAFRLYAEGHTLKQIAQAFGASERTLYRLILATDRRGWLQTQWMVAFEGANQQMDRLRWGSGDSIRNKADWRLDRIDKRLDRLPQDAKESS